MTYQFAETKGGAAAPLVFTFHGTGGSEDQFHSLASQLVPGAHVISPRGDVSEGGALRFFRRTGEGVYDMDDLAKRTVAMADFMAAQIDRIGPSEVMAFGYSNGANILAAVMLNRPDLVDRAGLLHPLIPWTPAAQPGLKGRRVLVTAGERDPICPKPQTDALLHYLAAQEVDLVAKWHPGGHEIVPDEVEALHGLLAG